MILAKASLRAAVCCCCCWEDFRVKIAGFVGWNAEALTVAPAPTPTGVADVLITTFPTFIAFPPDAVVDSTLVQSKISSFLNLSLI